MRQWWWSYWGFWLFLGWCSACATESYDPYQIARRDDESQRSKLDSVLLLVSVEASRSARHGSEAPSAEAASAGSASESRDAPHRRRVVDVTLAIDGKSLGTFAVSPRPRPQKTGAAGTFPALSDASGAALVIAKVGADLDARGLKTVSDWVAAFQRRLDTGSHVLEVTQVTLDVGAGKPKQYPASAYLPFSAADGATQAFAGHAKLVLAERTP